MRRRNARYARAGRMRKQRSASRQNRDVPQRACRQEFACVRECVNAARVPLASDAHRVHRFARMPLCHRVVFRSIPLSLHPVAPHMQIDDARVAARASARKRIRDSKQLRYRQVIL